MDAESLLAAAAQKQADDIAREKAQELADQKAVAEQFGSIVTALGQATQVLIRFLQSHETKISNFPDSIKTPDTDKVVKAVDKLGKTLKPNEQDDSKVLKALDEVKKAVKEIEMPITETVEVTNFKEMTTSLAKDLKSLQKAVEGLEMKPKITLPAPVVNVEKTNVKGIIKALEDVKQEVIDKPVPGTTVVPTDPLIRFTPANMDDATSVQYYSYIATDGEFYIRKVDKSGAYTTIRFYFGKGTAATHDTAWTGRAGLTYSMWTT